MRWLGLVALSLLSIACKPDVGSSCERGESRCKDKQTQLICSDGKLIAAPCRGDKGCQVSPTGVACDISKNQPGDACSSYEQGVAVCLDPKKMLVCASGKYQHAECRGPAGCTTTEGRANCDQTIANAGDPCKDVAKACSVDGKQVLICQAGKLALAFHCLGENGCKAQGGKIDCDLTVARDEDPCLQEMEGKVACNIDRRSIVVCKNKKFVIDEKCETGKTCSTEGGSIMCAKPEKD